jgi:hypothetical protein
VPVTVGDPSSGRQAEHVVNHVRVLTLCALLVAGSVVMLFVARDALNTGEPGGAAIATALGLLALAGGARAPLLGAWVRHDGLAVRSWARTQRFTWEQVSHFETVSRRDRVYPAVILADGRHVPLPMMEVGLVFELRDPNRQWGAKLEALNAELFRRRMQQ